MFPTFEYLCLNISAVLANLHLWVLKSDTIIMPLLIVQGKTFCLLHHQQNNVHSSNHLNKADTLLHLHLLSLRILAYNLTRLYVNAVVVAGLVDVGLVVVDFVVVVIAALVLVHLLSFCHVCPTLYLI